MNDTKSPHGRRSYHHGNLREALINAAVKLMTENGPEGVTLSEAARMAGVSPAAPYRHFKDRSTLMTAVAEQGFSAFADKLEQVWGKRSTDPVKALLEVTTAYLHFARDKPAYYSAMFEAGVTLGSSVTLSRESDRAFAILKDAATEVHAKLPADRRAPALMIALHIWSLVQGIASLFLRGDVARRNLPVTPEDLLESGILIYLDGLARA